MLMRVPQSPYVTWARMSDGWRMVTGASTVLPRVERCQGTSIAVCHVGLVLTDSRIEHGEQRNWIPSNMADRPRTESHIRYATHVANACPGGRMCNRQ